MDNASEDASEPSLLQTSETWLKHWETQKGNNLGVEIIWKTQQRRPQIRWRASS